MNKDLFYMKFKEFVQNGNLLLIFKKKGFYFKIINSDNIFDDIDENEFHSNLSSLLNCFISNGNSESDYVEYIEKIKNDLPELSNDILVKFNSYLPNITLFDIKSIKSKCGFEEVESFLVNLNLITSLDSKDEEISVNFELSKKDIKELINKLESVLK
ncbi:hypothetical protein ACSXAY_02630 [Clostridium perfringens]